MTVGTLATERNRNIISGAVGLLVLVALVTLGIKSAFGAFDGGYELHGRFAAAGQGLLEGSDVKVRGVNVGEVAEIELVDNRALITLTMDDGTRIPEKAKATIRPKTLFGEKFVDIELGDDETTGPYLSDGGEIAETLGGFELEQVLAEAYPVLEAIDPMELAVVLDELATAGDGLGESINRQIVNGSVLAELQASNDAEFRQFLSDFALLSEELDLLAPDLLGAAQDLNVALPSLNEREDQLNAALVQLARLSNDLADVFENNEEFTTNALTTGSESLQILYDRRSQIQPLLLGVQRYTQTIAEAIRVEVGDGSMMAAVKNLLVVHSEEPALPSGTAGEPDGPLDDGLLGGTVDDALGGVEDTTDDVTTPLLDVLLGGEG
jgi:phospholipid/cholesterol/gamma-HCH transport system substrate-binding protein